MSNVTKLKEKDVAFPSIWKNKFSCTCCPIRYPGCVVSICYNFGPCADHICQEIKMSTNEAARLSHHKKNK